MAGDDEICFPRGALKSKRKRKEEKTTRKKPKIKRKKIQDKVSKEVDSVEYDQDMIDELDALDAAPTHSNNIPYLTLNTIKEGLVLLGSVASIHEDQLIISLPFLLKGRLLAVHLCKAYADIYTNRISSTGSPSSPNFADLFEVGQLLVCSVLHVSEGLVELTLDPNIVNKKYDSSTFCSGMLVSGYVKSVEDHGCIVDIGKENIRAFLPATGPDQPRKYRKFQFLRCAITEIKCVGRLLLLSCQQKLLTKVTQKAAETNFFYPGTLVKFVPELSTCEGKFGKVSFHDACVSMLHLSCCSKQPDEAQNEDFLQQSKRNSELLLQDFLISKPSQGFVQDKNGSKIACVLYTTNDGVIALSANPSVWRANQRAVILKNYEEKFSVGRKYTAKVIEKLPIGTICQLHKSGVIGLVGSDHLADEHTDQTLDTVKKLKVRIIENLSFDGVIELSAKKNVYDAIYLTYSDVSCGEIVQAKILEISAGAGLKVALGSWQDKVFSTCNLQAIIPPLHMSDILLKRPEKLFKTGEVVTCRVLNVNLDARLVVLTHKKTLVQSQLPIITDYEQLNVDDVIHVYIKAIKQQGCVVGLYRNIKGFVPREELALPSTDTPIFEEYYLGQVIRARVRACDAKEKKLIMSFKATKKSKAIEL